MLFIGKANVIIIDIIVSMWKQHIFETIFTYNDFFNTPDSIVKGCGSR